MWRPHPQPRRLASAEQMPRLGHPPRLWVERPRVPLRWVLVCWGGLCRMEEEPVFRSACWRRAQLQEAALFRLVPGGWREKRNWRLTLLQHAGAKRLQFKSCSFSVASTNFCKPGRDLDSSENCIPSVRKNKPWFLEQPTPWVEPNQTFSLVLLRQMPSWLGMPESWQGCQGGSVGRPDTLSPTLQFTGTWYSIGLASNSRWFKEKKPVIKMCTTVVTPTEDGNLDVTSTYPK